MFLIQARKERTHRSLHSRTWDEFKLRLRLGWLSGLRRTLPSAVWVKVSSIEMPLPSTKKLVDVVANCVDDNLIGTVVRHDIEELRRKGQVTILSGGGSGHEPFAAGFVGRGMISAAVAGSVFTSPPPSNILAALRAIAVGNKAGALLLVLNYTGDRLTFGQAVERARLEGLKAEMVLIGDDCALASPNKCVGRRGLCGMVLMHKIAGALAEEGRRLEDIINITSNAAKKMGTIGVCLGPCSLPGAGPLFQMQPDEFELGMGIHGEAGVRKIKAQSASLVVEKMLGHMTSSESGSHLPLPQGSKVVLAVNNLGGLTTIEMNIVSKAALNYLAQRKVEVERCYIGTFQSALDMPGVSLTILHVTDVLLSCLDAPTSAPAWQQCGLGKLHAENLLYMEPLSTVPSHPRSIDLEGADLRKVDAELFKKVLHHCCAELVFNEVRLNALDSGCGDGDCGTTLKTGAQVIQAELDNNIDTYRPMKAFMTLADVTAESMGGTSGGLYSIFFTAAARALKDDANPLDWCHAMELGTKAIKQYGRAEPGDRTLVDPLNAAHTMLRAQLEVGSRPVVALTQAVEAAKEATASTVSMKPGVGRASYVSSEHLVQPDAGATAIVIILQAILDVVKAST